MNFESHKALNHYVTQQDLMPHKLVPVSLFAVDHELWSFLRTKYKTN